MKINATKNSNLGFHSFAIKASVLTSLLASVFITTPSLAQSLPQLSNSSIDYSAQAVSLVSKTINKVEEIDLDSMDKEDKEAQEKEEIASGIQEDKSNPINKKELAPEKEGKKSTPQPLKKGESKTASAPLTPSQLNKPNKDGKIVKLNWEVAIKNVDDGKLLQKTNFETDAEIKKLPFIVYEQEQASSQNNTQAVKEFIKTQFDLETSEPSKGYRVTRINMTTGKAVNGQKINDKEEVMSGNQFTGTNNKATFLHSCDNSTHTLLFQKFQLEVKCKK